MSDAIHFERWPQKSHIQKQDTAATQLVNEALAHLSELRNLGQDLRLGALGIMESTSLLHRGGGELARHAIHSVRLQCAILLC